MQKRLCNNDAADDFDTFKNQTAGALVVDFKLLAIFVL